jgi:hypothetical protein
MAEITEDDIKQRAHELWEQAGRPEGKELDFWLQAERELGVDKPTTGSSPEAEPRDKPEDI